MCVSDTVKVYTHFVAPYLERFISINHTNRQFIVRSIRHHQVQVYVSHTISTDRI